MKNYMKMAILLTAVIFFTACGGGSGEAYEYDETANGEYAYNGSEAEYYLYENGMDAEPPAEIIEVNYQPPSEQCEIEAAELAAAREKAAREAEQRLIAEMAHLLARMQALWDADGGEMWGVPLHIPLILNCNRTLVTVANRPNEQERFARQYVDGFPVYVGTRRREEMYTRLHWDGRMGLIWSWQALNMFTQGREEANLLMFAHGGFHTIQQEAFGFSLMVGADIARVSDSSDAWISFAMERRALIQALESTGDERLQIIHEALSIRDARRQAHESVDAENRFQILEGTADYTCMLIVYGPDRAVDAFVYYWIWQGDPVSAWSAVAQISYRGGATYGMLLSYYGVDWRPHVHQYADLGLMLKEALGITEFIPLEDIDLERFGYSEIAAQVRR